MEYLLTRLCEKQRALDKYIIESKGITLSEEDLFVNRITALIVEVGELANEVRSFKHWSNKGASPTEVVLEEYVDCLHFMLSITNQLHDWHELSDFENDYEVMPYVKNGTDVEKNRITNLFFIVMTFNLGALVVKADSSRYADCNVLMSTLWESFSRLGGMLGFTTNQVEIAYNAKYEKNIERQKAGY